MDNLVDVECLLLTSRRRRARGQTCSLCRGPGGRPALHHRIDIKAWAGDLLPGQTFGSPLGGSQSAYSMYSDAKSCSGPKGSPQETCGSSAVHPEPLSRQLRESTVTPGTEGETWPHGVTSPGVLRARPSPAWP